MDTKPVIVAVSAQKNDQTPIAQEKMRFPPNSSDAHPPMKLKIA